MNVRSHRIGSHSGPAYACCAGPENIFFTGGSDRIVAGWDLKKQGPHNLSIKTDNSIFSLAYALDSSTIFIGTSTGSIYWIDLQNKSEIKNFRIHEKGVFDLKVFDHHLYSCGGDGSIGVWDIKGQSLIRQVPLTDKKVRNVISTGDDLAVACGDGIVHILDDQLNEAHTIKAHEKGANSSLMTKNGLITGGWDGHLKLWGKSDYTLLKSIPAHNYAVYSLILVKDNIVSCSRDKTIKVWDNDLNSIKRIEVLQGGHSRSVNNLTEVLNGFVSVGDDGKVIFHEVYE